MAYQFTLYRPRDSGDFVLKGEGVHVTYRSGQENGFAAIGRVMHHLGLPDAPVSIHEIGAKPEHALMFQFDSSERLATLPVWYVAPQPLATYMYEALTALREGALAFNDIKWYVGQALVGRDMVVFGDDGATVLTDEAERLMADYKAAQEAVQAEDMPAYLTVKQCEAFEIVLNNPLRWSRLHGKTTKLMVRAGWVVMDGDTPQITGLGRQVYDGFLTREKRG